MRKTLVMLASIVACLGVATSARADVVAAEAVIVGEEPVPVPAPEPTGPDYAKPGAYAALGVGFLLEEFQGHLGDLGTGNSWGADLRGGYRFLPWLAVEGVYQYGNGFKEEDSADGSVDIRTNSFTVNAKGILPCGRFQPYLTAGIGLLAANQSRSGDYRSVDVSGVGFAARGGGGLDVFLTEDVALYAEATYLIPTGPTGDLEQVPVAWGAKFRF